MPNKTLGRPRTREIPDTEMTRRLAQARKRLKLSQSHMALYLGVSVVTYQSWEGGIREPSASVLRLLDVLGLVEVTAPELHAQLIP